MNRSDRSIVLVDGDVTIDWNLADLGPRDGHSLGWSAESQSRMSQQRGGAALLADLTASVLADISIASVETGPMPAEPVRNDDLRYHHAYAMWRRDSDDAWRVGQFLGVDPRASDLRVDTGEDVSPGVIVIDDAGLGYRSAESTWPHALREPSPNCWIVLKMASPVASGPLWNHLIRCCPERLIAVLTIDDLRRTEVQISRGLSWERTAQDVLWELVHNPCINGLGLCAHTVVSFGTVGAILHTRSNASARLLFDPLIMEGEWERADDGRLIGNTATLTAALVRQVVQSPDGPDFEAGIQAGVRAARVLYRKGYHCEAGRGDGLDVGFPIRDVAEAIRESSDVLAAVDVQDPVRFLDRSVKPSDAPGRPGFWTILENRYRDGLLGLSERIVLDGLQESLADVPVGRIGHLNTVDRHEIESLRSIQSLMREYCRHQRKQPLSIAVFGPPGSGKSFGVEQVAQSIEPGAIRKLTFNLSQFDHPEELLGALHQVRDVGLSGKLPLVFWDEFDTPLDGQSLGWLRYFLAPMQDGAFQEGQITHPIGRCIFVFAGGTSASMDEFATSLDTDDRRKAAKLPDFVSRLRGFLNVLGPNPQATTAGAADPYYVVRRAILLRSLLERSVPHLFWPQGGVRRLQIDRGVLRALLQISRYKHGVRSINAILSMSELAGRQGFQRSSLPAETQLDLHVNGREFLSLVQSIVLTDDLAEHLAEAAHEVWKAGKIRDEWTLGPRKDEEAKTHPWLIDYQDLPEHAKEANRVTVRTIPQKLAIAGYVMMPARSNEPPLEFPGDDLEVLAQFEHKLWMEEKLKAGFRLGKPTDDDPLQNEYLVEWEDIPNEIRQADRDLICGIPKILAKAGYAIMKLDAGT
ncbi:RyR domain protein [Maioricimonas rarisocia]|uniref:RyR domain protein n=1 Tax=Maioricimonas rarisocia TaxID=2528026 RepID=A0A517ZAU2_9PLAN|nr:RyR domain-containing protein [Maioricimonas rarisocia]QDU39625.1 RyR domain protein [Maioricimonas rarisocia]